VPKLSKSVFSVFVKNLSAFLLFDLRSSSSLQGIAQTSLVSALASFVGSLAEGKGDIRICGICVRIKAPLPFGKGLGRGAVFRLFRVFRCLFQMLFAVLNVHSVLQSIEH